MRCAEVQEENPQDEEEIVQREEAEAVGEHIRTSLTECTAREVLLHHVLIQARHHDDDEDTADELLPEVLRARPVIQEEDATVRVFPDQAHDAREVKPQLSRDDIDDESQREHKADRLQDIRPDDRTHTTTLRVEPDNADDPEDRDDIRHTYRSKDELLQDERDEEELRCCPEELRDDEEECTRAIAMPPEALLQIGIDRDELQTIVERQEDIGDDDVAKEEAQDQLHIAHIHLLHHPRHRDEGHTRD